MDEGCRGGVFIQFVCNIDVLVEVPCGHFVSAMKFLCGNGAGLKLLQYQSRAVEQCDLYILNIEYSIECSHSVCTRSFLQCSKTEW